MSSACSISSGNQHADINVVDKNKKKRGWVGVVVDTDSYIRFLCLDHIVSFNKMMSKNIDRF